MRVANRTFAPEPGLVSARGLEPPRPFGHQILNLARLPFRHADTVAILNTNLP